MELIPVIDLYQGQVVLAYQGKRKDYRPLHTPLCPSSDPLKVVTAYLTLHPFKYLYIADLDAIMTEKDNGIIYSEIRSRFPHITLWIDRGWPPLPGHPGQIPVIGSESLPQDWKPLLAATKPPWILSLDFDVNELKGPPDLLQCTEFWPGKVIVMSLSRVGSRAGPDLARLSSLIRKNPGRQWIAAGGIRNHQDLKQLQALGVHTALVASALHHGTLKNSPGGRI